MVLQNTMWMLFTVDIHHYMNSVSSKVPCSGDVWVESAAAVLFAEAQLKCSPVEGDKTLSVGQQRRHRLVIDPLLTDDEGLQGC